MITRVGLHPVTTISSLSKQDKEVLLETDVIFCSQLHEKPKLLKKLGIEGRKANRILNEVAAICNANSNHSER